MTIHDIYGALFRHFRASRMRRFYREMNVNSSTAILDVGGTPFNWLLAVEIGLPVPRRVVLLNLDALTCALPPWMSSIEGNATDLKGLGDTFDIVFSNSVIEHLGTWEEQMKMAGEVTRVAGKFWVQTPDPRFPIEPHYLAPGVHWVPLRWRGIAARLSPWYFLARPTALQIAARLAEIRLMGPREMADAFPDSKIIVERFLGWPKSLVAVKR